MKNINGKLTTPPTPRFDASEIDRLHKLATAFYEQPLDARSDAAEPSEADLNAMRAFIVDVDEDDALPAPYRDRPIYVAGIFLGSVRRSASKSYMARPRKSQSKASK